MTDTKLVLARLLKTQQSEHLFCMFAGGCELTWYKGSQFTPNAALVHTEFLGLMQKINDFASSCDVKVC